MAAVRLLLAAPDSSLRKIYWLRRRSGQVHAWCYAMPDLLPRRDPDLCVEVHWTYPPDGNIHTSIYVRNGDVRVGIIRVFRDRLLLRDFGASSDATATLRALESGPLLSYLLPAGYLPQPISAYQHEAAFFSFPSVGLPVNSPSVSKLPVASEIRATDLVVPSTSGGASFFASLHGRGYESRSDGPAGAPAYVRFENSAYPQLCVGAFVPKHSAA